MKQFINVPDELKQLPQWVCRKEKIPFNPVTGATAKAGQPATWLRFEDCVNALEDRDYDGIGFEFNNNGIVGIDLDHVIAEDGSLSVKAVEIVAMLNSYTEYSPSGKGLHIFVRGDIPVDGRKKGFIEMYKAKRYFTMTGNVYGELKPINERSEQVMQIFNKYFNGLPYAMAKDDKHIAKLERSDYLQRTVTKAMQGLTSTAILDDEQYTRSQDFSLDDMGNARRLVSMYGHNIRFSYISDSERTCHYGIKAFRALM